MEDVVGFRFRPTEEEIIAYYLERKLRGLEFPVHVISEVGMNALEPWDLPVYSAIQSDDRVWYFFTAPHYMDAKKTRINRKTPAGFWKVTGKDRLVRDRNGREIGLKRTLVFHTGRSPHGVGTCWAMQEFHYKDATRLYRKPYVVCRLKSKPDDRSASNSGNQIAVNLVLQENDDLSFDLQSILDNDVFPGGLILPVERPSSSNVSVNEPNASRSLLDTSEQDDDFVNSLLLTDEDEHIHEETVQAHPHDFKPAKLLRGYVETAHPQKRELVETPSLFRVDSQDDSILHAFSGSVAQMDGVGLCKKEEASLSHEKILKTVQISGKAETSTLFRGHLYRGRSQGNSMLRTRDVAEMTGGVVAQMGGGALHEKEETSLSHEKIPKKVQISGKASSKSLSDGSNGSSRKSSFLCQETPPSSHKQDPPSVYIVNIVVALILLAFFVREMASLH
uniref:NAC transcription factor 71 n=1 Tax=Litchi chinensis TaxID=151069 RepID=A0A8K1I002_LITCN|nr:NAC transcription factor 71 [Litchi chinensis]